MAFVACTPAEIAAGQPTKQELFQKLCDNGDDHETRIADLETDAAVTLLVGEIRMFGGASPPTGWVFCDGQLLDQTTEANLFAVIGSEYDQGGEGPNEFRTPDFRGKVPGGVNNGTLTNGTDGSYTTRNRADGTPGGAPGAIGTETENLNHLHTFVHTHQTEAHNHRWYSNEPIGSDDRTFDVNGAGVALTDGLAKFPVAMRFLKLFNTTAPDRPVRNSASVFSYTNNAAPNTVTQSTDNTSTGLSIENNMQPTLFVNFIIKT